MNAVVDFPVKPEARPYLDAFERGVGHNASLEPPWLAHARRQAIARFAEAGFPSRKSEDWRYLDLRSLEQDPLLPLDPFRAPEFEAEARARLAELHLPSSRLRLVSVDGLFLHRLSTIDWPMDGGVWVGPVSSAFAERLQLVPALVKSEGGGSTHPFAAVNTAFFGDGYILDIAPGVAFDEPVQIVHLATGARENSFHTRSLINLGEGARAAIVEIYAGDGRYWRNDIVAVRLAAGAELNRTVLVEEAAAAVHFGHVEANLARAARLSGFALLLGGSRVRQEWDVRLAGEGARCRLDGGFLVAGSDEANIVTAVDHAAPGGETRELVKGVAADRGHGAFQGRITVRPGAQKTDARQLSRNLLIGRRAVIDTKPELEILADDVKCSHGASVGDLDAAALFYMRSRGIPTAEARRMLIEGFLREAVEEIADRALREHLLGRLALSLGRLGTLEG
jgi:Fe-S cluster assembly protein SufD